MPTSTIDKNAAGGRPRQHELLPAGKKRFEEEWMNFVVEEATSPEKSQPKRGATNEDSGNSGSTQKEEVQALRRKIADFKSTLQDEQLEKHWALAERNVMKREIDKLMEELESKDREKEKLIHDNEDIKRDLAQLKRGLATETQETQRMTEEYGQQADVMAREIADLERVFENEHMDKHWAIWDNKVRKREIAKVMEELAIKDRGNETFLEENVAMKCYIAQLKLGLASKNEEKQMIIGENDQKAKNMMLEIAPLKMILDTRGREKDMVMGKNRLMQCKVAQLKVELAIRDQEKKKNIIQNANKAEVRRREIAEVRIKLGTGAERRRNLWG
jgi:hypothetical protein